MTPADFALRLAGLPIAQAKAGALEHAAQLLAEAVRARLSETPGGDHASPWQRTGSLRDSVGHEVDDDVAVVGSRDPVAVFQELGTAHVSPRPFLSPVAAQLAETVARDIATLIGDMLG